MKNDLPTALRGFGLVGMTTKEPLSSSSLPLRDESMLAVESKLLGCLKFPSLAGITFEALLKYLCGGGGVVLTKGGDGDVRMEVALGSWWLGDDLW